MINSEQEYNDSMRGGAEYEHECYQDLESKESADSLVQRMKIMASIQGNDFELGGIFRKMLKRY